jgi:very-short-patch-repair endonuclease
VQGNTPSNYASNAVACKLWGLIESAPELILGVAIFNELSTLYDGWCCRVFSADEFAAASHSLEGQQGLFAVVPQLTIHGVGRVDFAIFIPEIGICEPEVLIECDGHDFHDRTVEQASEDRRRDRVLHRLMIPVLRFTGTDVIRKEVDTAWEIAEFVDMRFNEKCRLNADATELYARRCGAL